jgi:hypothetical protein
MTPSGIETVTFRFVAQCLNQLRHLVTADVGVWRKNWSTVFVIYC